MMAEPNGNGPSPMADILLPNALIETIRGQNFAEVGPRYSDLVNFAYF